MRKTRTAFYVAAGATMIAVLVESFQEQDVSSAALTFCAIICLVALFLGEPGDGPR